MNIKQKDEQYKLFAEAFHEVVVPELQDTNVRLERIDDLEALTNVSPSLFT